MSENTNNPVQNPTVQHFTPVSYAPPPPPPRPIRAYGGSESIFAWISFFAGYLFCRAFPAASHPLGAFLFIAALFTSTTVILGIKRVKFGVIPSLVGASAVVMSASLPLTGNSLLGSFAYCYSLAAYCYFVYAATGNRARRGFSDMVAVDFFKALFIMPFRSYGQLFRGMFYGKSKGGRMMLKILVGICLGVVPTCIVLSLLSYDSDFTNLLSKIFDFEIWDIFSHTFSLGFGIFIGMYIFGLFVSSVDRKCADVLTATKCTEGLKKASVAPVATVVSAVLPILVLYAIFFISQWKYYISGFTGVLPEQFSYAEYAREGFFQLCWVAVINLLIIILVSLLIRRGKNRESVALKILSLVFSAATLVLIATAVAKMLMYIDCYGLTRKRVYATWFMAVIAVIFVLVVIRQFAPRFKIIAVSMTVCAVLFSALALGNVDALIARYNVDRYIAGTLDEVDIYATLELGDAAVPELVRYAEEMENLNENGKLDFKRKTAYNTTINELKTLKEQYEQEEYDIFSYTLPRIKAIKSLEKLDSLN